MSVVRSACAGHKNVIILEQKNQGLSAARMNGLSAAQGEYVWFVDSDDWLDANAVNVVLTYITQIKPDVLVSPLYWRFEDSTRDYIDINISENRTCTGKEYLNELFLPAWAAPRFILKRRLFEDCPDLFFPKNLFHEDEYFGRALLYIVHNVYILKDSIYNYRQREGSIMSSLSIQNAYDLVEIHKLLIRFLTSIQRDDEQWFRNNIFKNVLSTSYYRCSFCNRKDFNKFLYKNRTYVVAEYFRTKPRKSTRKIIGDILFFLVPRCYTKIKGVRYM